MLPFALALVVLGLERRPATLDLATVAQGSPTASRMSRGRRVGLGAAGDGLWSRLRDADSQRYCELLARGYARLRSAPKDAWLAAQAAEALAGARPAVRVLSARALLRLDQSGTAFEQFELAQAEDAQAFADPKALHDYARRRLARGPTRSPRCARTACSCRAPRCSTFRASAPSAKSKPPLTCLPPVPASTKRSAT